jgi:glycerol-3-phosphate acyltransferase PlsY
MMEAAIRLVLSWGIAFLLGSIPVAVIVSKHFYDCDVREHGSGNMGATNVFRVLGWKAGLIVATLDVLKGTAAAGAAYLITASGVDPAIADWVVIGAALAAMAGHSYSPWVKLRGGKGIATAAGALLIITPWSIPIQLFSFVFAIYLTRMVSVGSLVAAIEFPILSILLYGDNIAIVITSFVAAALAIWRHRANIVRIYRGEEARIGDRSESVRQTIDGLAADVRNAHDDSCAESEDS